MTPLIPSDLSAGLARNTPQPSNPLQPSTTASQPILAGLAHGATVTARVAAQLQADLFLLNLGGQKGGQQLAAHSNLPLSVGDKLVTTVDRNGPALLLRVNSNGNPLNRQPNSLVVRSQGQLAVVNQAMRWALPRQQPINSLLDRLEKLSVGQTQSSLLSPLKLIIDQAPDPRQLLQPRQLARALTNSGVLLEHNLLKSPDQPPEHDFKASLLRALQVATNTPAADVAGNRVAKQLHDITTSALARIETQQLATINDERGQRILTTDLILRDAERTSAVEIEIDRRPGRNEDEIDPDDPSLATASAEHRWQVTLNLNLPGIGKLKSLIRLDSSGVSIDFRSDQPETLDRLTSRFEQFTERLSSAGMADSHLTAGLLADEPSLPIAPSGHLIDLVG